MSSVGSLGTNPFKNYSNQQINQSQPISPNQHLTASRNASEASTNPFKQQTANNYVGLGPSVENRTALGFGGKRGIVNDIAVC